MHLTAEIAGWAAFGVLAGLVLLMLLTFAREREARAAGLTLLLGLPPVAGLLAVLLLGFPGRSLILLGAAGALVLAGLVLVLPLGRPSELRVVGERARVDERDAVFHRFYRLEPGTPEFEAYYAEHPDKREADDKIRAHPQLGAPGSKDYHAQSSPYMRASFSVLEALTREIDWKPEPLEGRPVEAGPEELARRIKGFSRYLGADLVGCTALNQADVYSHIGRSPGTWGEPIELQGHTHAVAVGVGMSHEMVRHGPRSPATTETAFRYFEAGKIALLLARYLNLLGYEARAHVDANYRVMCVPVAASAGLGELGRLGLLISPEFGPRMRLAVVTTSAPLAQDAAARFGVQEFCEICKKCAFCCPSGSIDRGDRQEHNGVLKWQSEQDSCYRYWRIAGTDCSVCLKVCPYSHPHGVLHDAVRFLIRRNGLTRRLALWGDDLFYGRRRETTYPLPDWHR